MNEAIKRFDLAHAALARAERLYEKELYASAAGELRIANELVTALRREMVDTTLGRPALDPRDPVRA